MFVVGCLLPHSTDVPPLQCRISGDRQLCWLLRLKSIGFCSKLYPLPGGGWAPYFNLWQYICLASPFHVATIDLHTRIHAPRLQRTLQAPSVQPAAVGQQGAEVCTPASAIS